MDGGMNATRSPVRLKGNSYQWRSGMIPTKIGLHIAIWLIVVDNSSLTYDITESLRPLSYAADLQELTKLNT